MRRVRVGGVGMEVACESDRVPHWTDYTPTVADQLGPHRRVVRVGRLGVDARNRIVPERLQGRNGHLRLDGQSVIARLADTGNARHTDKHLQPVRADRQTGVYREVEPGKGHGAIRFDGLRRSRKRV